MDAFVEFIAQQAAGALVGAILVGGPVVLIFALRAFKKHAEKTPGKFDDELAAALLRAAENRGHRKALEGSGDEG